MTVNFSLGITDRSEGHNVRCSQCSPAVGHCVARDCQGYLVDRSARVEQSVIDQLPRKNPDAINQVYEAALKAVSNAYDLHASCRPNCR